jgi:hypothetical protein
MVTTGTDNLKAELDNVSKLKNLASKYSHKEIKFNFFEKLSRLIYSNPDYLAKIEFIQYIIFLVLLYIYNPFDIKTKYPVFTQILVLIVSFTYVILFFFISKKVKEAEDVDLISPTENTIIYQFLSTIVFFVLFMLAIKGVLWLFANTRLINIFNHGMTLFIIFGALGIIHLFTKKYINKAKNAPGKSFLNLLVKMVMYVPCLMVDFVEAIKYEFNLTTKPVWILTAVETGLIGLWFLVPFLFDKIMRLNGLKLLDDPVNLNIETVIGNFNTRNPNDSKISIDQLYSNMANAKAEQSDDSLDNAPDTSSRYADPNDPPKSTLFPWLNEYIAWIYEKYKNLSSLKISFSKHPQYTDYETDRFSYNYALSGWFYINSQPPNTSAAYSVYTNIFSYGNKIKVEYNGKLNSLRVIAATAAPGKPADGTDTKGNNRMTEVYQTNNIIYQKWNNIVINYADGFIDVFLNGVIVASISGAVPYMYFDTITVGAKNGILGGMCNVNYYKDIMSEKTIKLTYKSLREKSLPTI